MKVLIFAVCVNIALVNAQVSDYLDVIMKLIKGRRLNDPDTASTNEPVEAVRMLPRLYLQKPTELSKSLYKYPKDNAKYLPVSSGWNHIAPRKNLTAYSKTNQKVQTLNSGSKNGYLTAKILKAVKSLAKPRESKKLKTIKPTNNLLQKPYENIVSKNDDQLVKLLLAKMVNGIITKNDNHLYDYRENDNYKYGITEEDTGSSDSFSHNADKILIKKWLANKILGINRDNDDEASIKYDNTEERSIANSLKDENLVENILKAIDSMNLCQKPEKPRSPIIVIETDSHLPKTLQTKNIEDLLNGVQQKTSLEFSDEIDNDANESLDEYNSSDNLYNLDFRRKADKKDKKDKLDKEDCSEGTIEDSSEDTEEYEKNPGNPYTIHKNKYKQNWQWNHYMDGDHMNINSFGPQFPSQGPSGPELFFGRKWWYFNQDDYKPMG